MDEVDGLDEVDGVDEVDGLDEVDGVYGVDGVDGLLNAAGAGLMVHRNSRSSSADLMDWFEGDSFAG